MRLPGKENSNSHGARPVHLIITMLKWIRTRRLSIKNSLSGIYGSEFRVSASKEQVMRPHDGLHGFHCKTTLDNFHVEPIFGYKLVHALHPDYRGTSLIRKSPPPRTAI